MNEWGVFLAVLGVWGWIGSVLMFMFQVFPARGVFLVKKGLAWGTAGLFFFGCWIVGMLVA